MASTRFTEDSDVEDVDLGVENDDLAPQRGEYSAVNILEAAENLDYVNENDFQEFRDKFERTLSIQEKKSKDGNVLHELSGRNPSDAGGKTDKWSPDRIKKFLDFILDEGRGRYSHLLETENQVGGHMPLHNALYKENHCFVGLVLEKLKGDKSLKPTMEKILRHTTTDQMNCLHLAILYDSNHTELLIDLCRSINGTNDGMEGREKAADPTHESNRLPSVFRQRDSKGLTPLHYAASVKNTDEYDIEFESSDAPTVAPSRTADLARGNTHVMEHAHALQMPGDADEKNTAIYLHTSRASPETPQSSSLPAQVLNAHVQGTQMQDRMPITEAGQLMSIKIKAPDTDLRQLKMVELLMQADPLSLVRGPQSSEPKQAARSTTYCCSPFEEREGGIVRKVKRKMKSLISQTDNTRKQAVINFVSNEFEKLRGNDEILSTIRNFCLEKFSRYRKKIIQCLYAPGSERHIEFSLSGLRRQNIRWDYLHGLGLHLQFESVLACVTLPRLRVRPSVQDDDMDQPGYNFNNLTGTTTNAMTKRQKKGKGLSDLITIFDWLRSKHVQKVRKVVVIDDGDPCHSDEAIERALGGFDILAWDWKRLDICSEVIFNCAPNVREVSLYWSGSQSTLLGWYSDQGFLHKKFKKVSEGISSMAYSFRSQTHPEAISLQLKNIIIYYRKGLESEGRLWTYLEAFRARIEEQKEEETGKPRVQVDLQQDFEDKSFLSGFKSAGADLTDNSWFGAMKPILSCVQTMPQRRPLRIAIIDDGIDASLPIFDSRIASGASFSSSLGIGDSDTPYFVSSGHHGTLMGALILRLCPKAKLLVAKLDGRYGTNGEHRITAKSAADAINWALDAKVDIISMSWTIEMTNGNPAEPQLFELKSLEEAVQRSANSGVLTFCAASDQGNSTMLRSYPGHWKNSHRIGAATGTGERCAWVHPETFDHLLPGEKIAYDLQDPSSPSEHSGSSVATAIAAGLAGLIILLHRKHNPDALQDHFCKRENMEKAFRYLGHPFPHVDKLKFLANKNWENNKHQKDIEDGLKTLFHGLNAFVVRPSSY